MEDRSGVKFAVVYLILVTLTGIAGFVHFEGKTVLDSIYLVVICLSTVGMATAGAEVSTNMGKLLTLFVILNGVGVAGYLFTVGARAIIGGELHKIMGLRRMLQKIRKMENHFIICGGGESSMQIIKDFEHSKAEFVLIEIDEDKCEQFINRGFAVIHGDAEKEEILRDAGIERARGLVANLDNDADNVFIVLTARSLNPDLFIVTKASRVENIEKLKKVGADRVVSPSIIGGRRMAASLLKTSVVDFLDVVIQGEGEMELQMESMAITEKGELAGKLLKESGIRTRSGVIVVALQHDKNFFVNPGPDTMLNVGDRMIVLGRTEQIQRLCEFI